MQVLKNTPFTIFKIAAFCYILLSSSTWFAVGHSLTVIIGLFCVIMTILILMMALKIKLYFPANLLGVVLAMLAVSIWFAVNNGLIFGIFAFFRLLPAAYLFIMPPELKKELLAFYTKWFAIFCTIGLIIYFVTFIKLFPPIGIVDVGSDNFYPPFLNYFFYIRPTILYGDVLRYQAFFLEPGHLGIACVFIMFANKLNFKDNKYMWMLLITIIFSLSLAGYLLLAISWLLLKSNGIKAIISTAFIGGILIFGGQVWNGGDNYLNNYIFARLETDNEKGIEGNNRTDDNTDRIFNAMIGNGQIFTGHPNASNLKVFGAGYKVYLINHGLISALLMLAFYWTLRSPYCNKRFANSFLLLLILTFCDCEYIEWYTYLAPYILGIGEPENLIISQNNY